MDDSKGKTLSDVLKRLEVDETQPVKLTFEEVKSYILYQMESYKNDPKYNSLLAQKNEITYLDAELRALRTKYARLQKNFIALHKDQINFKKRTGEDTKTIYESVGVGVDMDVLPETIPVQIFNDWCRKNAENNTKPFVKKETGPVECIDLSSDDESSKSTDTKDIKPLNSTFAIAPKKSPPPAYKNPSPAYKSQSKPPVPLPSSPPRGRSASDIPPKPLLGISADNKGITLQWKFPEGTRTMDLTNYEIFGYQERRISSGSGAQWEKIGCVKAMTLPMSCTLTQFMEGSKYHFCVRAIANHKIGHFSDPASIMLVSDLKKK